MKERFSDLFADLLAAAKTNAANKWRLRTVFCLCAGIYVVVPARNKYLRSHRASGFVANNYLFLNSQQSPL